MKLYKISMIAIAITAIFSVSSFSQSVGLGIEGGLNMANVNINNNAPTSSNTGFLAGGFVDLGVSDIISIKPGVRYVMKGFTSAGNGITYNVKLNYIEMPMLLKISIPLAKIKPYFEAGPTFSFNVSASQDRTDGQNFATDDLSQAIESIDIGMYIGSGLGFHVANRTEIFTGFGYSLGFTNFLKNEQTRTMKNNGFRMTAGVRFGL